MPSIQTKQYGTVEIDERQIIDFPAGLFGFERLCRFALLDSHRPPFYILQSLEEPATAFVLIDPMVFRPDYTLDVTEEDLEAVGAEDVQELLVFAIVTIPDDERLMTANLQGPLVINRKRRVGRQTISTNPSWGLRHTILEELERLRTNAC